MTTTRHTRLRVTVAPIVVLAVLLSVPAQRVVAGMNGARAGMMSSIGVDSSLHRMSNGKIVFADLRAGHEGLDVINVNGTGFRQLARCPTPGCFFAGYRWSPDGRQMAFLRAPRASNLIRATFSLFVINANGGGGRRLASCSQPNDCVGGSLAWSPDGSRILFSRFSLGIYIVTLGTGNVHRITNCGANYCGDLSPSWSPDGSRILFSRAPGCRGGCPSSPYVMNTDGSGMKRLSFDRGAGTALWSPGGRTIAFSANGIYAVDPNGSHLRLLVPGPPNRANRLQTVAGWSPDGKHILYVSNPWMMGPRGPRPQSTALWVMQANGTGQRRLYRAGKGFLGSATWSPDGQFIAFSVEVDRGDGRVDASRSGLFVMTADGRHPHRLAAGGYEPAWQPIL